MDILNKTDFSAEILVQLAIILEAVYAAEILPIRSAILLTTMVM